MLYQSSYSVRSLRYTKIATAYSTLCCTDGVQYVLQYTNLVVSLIQSISTSHLSIETRTVLCRRALCGTVIYSENVSCCCTHSSHSSSLSVNMLLWPLLVASARPSQYTRIATVYSTFYCTISLQRTVLYCIDILAPGG